MPTTTCFCGAALTGDDHDAHVQASYAHFTSTHPEFNLTETQVRNYIEREAMLEPPSARVEALGVVEVVPLGPDRVTDVLEFFDRHAFADNPGWASCYCLAHHVEEGEGTPSWGARTWQDSRAELAARIRSGRTTGVLCYVDGKLVGWCNASRRREFPHYATGEDDWAACVAACFIVAPAYRGHGIARQLLDATIEHCRDNEIKEVEGRPHADPQWSGAAYHGTVRLFEQAGFHKVADSPPSVILRRST